MVLISDNLSPFFRVIITGGHNDCYLFRPRRTKLQYTLVNLHCDRARIGNNHCFAGQKIFTVVFVMVENIANKRIDRVVVAENSFHLSKLFFALFNHFGIGILGHNVVFGVNQLQRLFIKIKFDNTALIVNRAGSTVLDSLSHIVNVYVIAEHLTSASVF